MKEGTLIKSGTVFLRVEIPPSVCKPKNADNGYLEHFIENLIEKDDWVLSEAKDKVDELLTKDDCRFTEVKKQKAVIYSWLAWQETPGLPFGTALDAGYLNHKKVFLQPFLNWIGRSFQF